LEIPKDIATNRKKLVPGHSSTIVQTFMPIGGTVAEIFDSIQKTNTQHIYDKGKGKR